jgi:hypothetical protein
MQQIKRPGDIVVKYQLSLPIIVVARPKAWTAFARLNAGIVGSNPTQGMNVCVCLFSVVLFCV